MSSKLVFSLKAPTHPQNPITNINNPITKNIKAGSSNTPIDKSLSLLNVSFSIQA